MLQALAQANHQARAPVLSRINCKTLPDKHSQVVAALFSVCPCRYQLILWKLFFPCLDEFLQLGLAECSYPMPQTLQCLQGVGTALH